MFRSYEAGREDFVTLVANYLPLQDRLRRPELLRARPDAPLRDPRRQRRRRARGPHLPASASRTSSSDIALPIGPAAAEDVAVPLINVGGRSAPPTPQPQRRSRPTRVDVVRGDRRTGTARCGDQRRRPAATTFAKPVDNIGNKSIAGLRGLRRRSIVYDIDMPGCGDRPRVRRPAQGPVRGEPRRDLRPRQHEPARPGRRRAGRPRRQERHLARPRGPDRAASRGRRAVIGGWTTASLRQARMLNAEPERQKAEIDGGAFAQVSRLGMPLVNEVVIGLQGQGPLQRQRAEDDAPVRRPT